MSAMRKTVDHHHSTEQVEGYTRTALDIADRLGMDEIDRAALLPTILTLVSSKQVFYEQAPPLAAMHIPRNNG